MLTNKKTSIKDGLLEGGDLEKNKYKDNLPKNKGTFVGTIIGNGAYDGQEYEVREEKDNTGKSLYYATMRNSDGTDADVEVLLADLPDNKVMVYKEGEVKKNERGEYEKDQHNQCSMVVQD